MVTAQSSDSSPWYPFIRQAFSGRRLGEAEQTLLIEAYRENDWRPLFINAQLQPTARAQTLLRTLSEMGEQGLDPQPYHLQELHQQIAKLLELQTVLHASNPDLQTFLSHFERTQPAAATSTTPPVSSQPANLAAATTSTSDPATGKPIPQPYRSALETASSVDTQLATCLVRYARQMFPFSSQGQLPALLGKVSLSNFLQQLEPVSPHYAPLCQALAKYRRLAQTNSFIPLPEKTLDPGDRGPAVRLLQFRLSQEGYYSGAITGRFDHATKLAVQNFQLTHMVAVDGVVGPHTLSRMNVSYRRQAELIAISLRLLRHSRTRLFQRFVWVNIPQFDLEYYRQNKLQSVHRVIVGRASGTKTKVEGRWMTVNQTPTLVSSIKEVVINPRWYVSDRIRLELNKDVAKDPNFFSSNGYVEMSSTYPWGAPRLFQRPGPTNPLGRVKFEFPNPFAIYLHDTPDKQFFSKSQRDLSHGCIRMSKALLFAKHLLEDDHNRAAQNMTRYLETERQIFIKLHHPVPIIVDYIPVSTNQQGQIVFCGDPYGWYKF